MIVHTCNIRYRGPHRVDITRKSGEGFALAFAPSWDILGPRIRARREEGKVFTQAENEDYRILYTEEMRRSFCVQRSSWNHLLEMPRAVLVCYCAEGAFCHRLILAQDILTKLGAVYCGEIHLRNKHETAGHECHVPDCHTPCKPEHLMCAPCWKQVPLGLQHEVYRHYRAGQCEDMIVTRAWVKAAKAAIEAVRPQLKLAL